MTGRQGRDDDRVQGADAGGTGAAPARTGRGHGELGHGDSSAGEGRGIRGAGALSAHQVHEPAAHVLADRQRISAEVIQQSCQPGGLVVLPPPATCPTPKRRAAETAVATRPTLRTLFVLVNTSVLGSVFK
ncbi:hypothetical protein STTU_p0117 (plasmid) [Streptomyces sp. Tu6071]|nr:hypothetical protein STTU_p0117 [Streptomyces sp. Tu6071]